MTIELDVDPGFESLKAMVRSTITSMPRRERLEFAGRMRRLADWVELFEGEPSKKKAWVGKSK